MKTESGQKRAREGVSGGSGGSLRVRLFEDLLIAAVIALNTEFDVFGNPTCENLENTSLGQKRQKTKRFIFPGTSFIFYFFPKFWGSFLRVR